MHPIKATVQDTTRSSNRIKNENQPTSLVTRIDNLEIKELSKPKDSEIHLKDKKFKKCHPEHSPSEIASLPMLPLGDLPKDASHSSVEESRGRHGRSPKQKTSLSPPRFKTSISPKRSKGSSVTKQSFDHLTSSGGSESPSRSGSEPRTPPSRQSSPRTPVSTPDYPRYKPPSPLLSGSTGDNPLNIQEQKISLPPFTGPLLDAASLVSNAIRNSTSGNICRFEVLLDSDAITLDNELRVLLFKIIDKIRNKQSDFLSAEESWHSHSIDKIMRAFTNPHMSFERYKKKAHIAAGQIYYEATETSNLKIIFKDVIKNLETLRKEIWCFLKLNNNRSKWSSSFYEVVDSLLTSKNIEVFHQRIGEHLFNDDLKVSNKKLGNSAMDSQHLTIPEFLCYAFGSSQEQNESVIVNLNVWSTKTNRNLLVNEIYNFLLKTASLICKSRDITHFEHHLDQNIDSPLHIGKITSEAIIRSLKPSAESDTVLFNEILVNNKTCYPAVHEGLPPVQLSPPQAFKEERPIKNHATPKQRSNQQDDTPTKSDLDFYSSLFGSFAKILPILHPTLPRIVDEARAFLALDCEESLKYGKNHSLLIKQFDKDIPGMGILRLMTNDSFGYAMDYILKLYPALIRKYGSDTPYDLKFLKGITCNVSIDDAGGYFVSQKKKAEICRTGHHNPSIASLEIEWTLSPMKNGWKGILKILSYEIHSDRYWLDLTSILANPVDLSKEPFPKSCQYISKLSGSTRD